MALFREETRIRRPLRRHAVSDASIPRRFVLRGRVVTMDAGATVIPDGLVCIQDDSITAVASTGTPLPREFQQAPIVQSLGTIYPGLIELHNHPAYNAIPLWGVPQRYPSRTQWRADPVYKRRVLNPASLLTHHPQEIYPKSVARFVECRALLGGVTTTQGLTLTSLGSTAPYYEGLIRNVEFSYGTNWPTATDHINDFTSFSEFDDAYGPLMNQSLSRFVIHLCEGTDAATKAIFGNLIDSAGKALIGSNLVAIHATALGAAELVSLQASAGVVWSPTSNFLLYGATTDISDAISAGVAIALGCDWAPSGTKNLLGELKIARATSQHLGNLFSDQQLVGMVTTVPAKMIGWDTFLGSIESGKQADLTVIGTSSGNPYSALISATESDVAAVVIGGKVRAGRASLVDPRTSGVELIRVAEQDMVLDLVDDPTQPLAKISLQASIATLSYALEHLPDVAKTAISGHAQMKGVLNAFQIKLEMDEHVAEDAAAGVSPIQPGDVDPMELDPITGVDDKTFVSRLQSNPNLPDWLKAAM